MTKGIADLARFARSKGINLAILKNMNPWLRETSLSNHSGRTYVIKIPTKEGMTYDPKKTVAHDKRWVIEELSIIQHSIINLPVFLHSIYNKQPRPHVRPYHNADISGPPCVYVPGS